MKGDNEHKTWRKKNNPTLLFLGLFFGFIFSFFFTANHASAINQQISFQGKLTNSSGNIVTDGAYYLKLTIYNDPTAGSCQYTAAGSCGSVTTTPVTVTGGIFSVNLGDTGSSLNALSSSLFNTDALYLGLTVCSGPNTGCDAEMTPRKRITAAPYAFNADRLSGLATSTQGGDYSFIPATDSSGNLSLSNSLYIASSTAGQFAVGSSTAPSGIKAYVEATSAADNLLTIRANANQTGNFMEWQDSSGANMGTLSSSTLTNYILPDGSSTNMYDALALTLGNYQTRHYGYIILDANNNNNNGGYIINRKGYSSGMLSDNSLTLSLNGSATTTYNINSINFNKTSLNPSGTFSLDSSGNISASGTLSVFGNFSIVNGVAYTWPSSQGGANTYLKNDGSGGLSWATVTGGTGVNDWGRFGTTYGVSALMTSSTYPVWFDGNVYASSSMKISGSNAYLDIGGSGNGLAQLYIQATSSAANPLLINDSSGFSMLSFTSSSIQSVVGGSLSESTGFAKLTLGDINGLYGGLVLQSSAVIPNAGANLILKSNTNNIAAELIDYGSGPSEQGGNLLLAKGSVTTTLNNDAFTYAMQSGYSSGVFKVDSSGNISASGTLSVFGNFSIVNGVAYTWPSSQGGANTYLKNDGSGGLSWATVTGGTGVNDWGRFGTTYGVSALMTSSTYPVWFDADVFASSSVKISANSNTAVPLAIYDTDGSLIASLSSSTTRVPVFDVDTTFYGASVLNLGNNTDSIGGFINLYSGTNPASGLSFFSSGRYTGGLLSSPTPNHPDSLNFITGTGTATSTYTAIDLTVNRTTGFDTGKFYIDSSGNVSASGTLSVFGSTILGSSDAAGGNTARIYGALAMGVNPTGNAMISLNATSSSAMPLLIKADLNQSATSYLTEWQNGSGSTMASMASDTPDYVVLTLGKQNITNGKLAVFNSTGESQLFGTKLSIGGNSGINYGNGFFLVESPGNVSVSGTLRVFGTSSNNGFYASATDATTTIASNPVDAAGSTGFYFNTVSPLSSSTDRMLAVFANGGTNKVMISPGGNVYAKNSFIANSTDYGIGDVAEYVNLTPGETTEAGDVLVIDTSGSNTYKKSSSAYAKNVAGVISDTGKFVIGASGDNRAPLALAGLVKVKVTNENGPINPGDYLITSSKPGYAMKYDSSSTSTSAGLVGMALEPLLDNEGKITILVNKGLVAGSNEKISMSVNENGQLTSGATTDFAGNTLTNVAAISSFSGMWHIDAEGSLVAKNIKTDKIQTKELVLEKDQTAEKSTIGEANIKFGQNGIEVINDNVKQNSKIFITFRGNPGSFWWISNQEDGKFSVSLSAVATQDIIFDYWLVNVFEDPIPAVKQTNQINNVITDDYSNTDTSTSTDATTTTIETTSTTPTDSNTANNESSTNVETNSSIPTASDSSSSAQPATPETTTQETVTVPAVQESNPVPSTTSQENETIQEVVITPSPPADTTVPPPVESPSPTN